MVDLRFLEREEIRVVAVTRRQMHVLGGQTVVVGPGAAVASGQKRLQHLRILGAAFVSPPPQRHLRQAFQNSKTTQKHNPTIHVALKERLIFNSKNKSIQKDG